MNDTPGEQPQPEPGVPDDAQAGAPARQDEPKLSRKKVLLFTLIVFAFFYVLLEIAAGVYLGARYEEYGFDLGVQAEGTMVADPYQVWSHPANYTTWSQKTHLNNHGFRRFEDTAVDKPEGVTRIFIVGGSTAYGSQPTGIFSRLSGWGEYSNDETISAAMERQLTERHPGRKFEVINAATNWSRIHQGMLHYMRKLRSFEPDLIISIDGQNDSTMYPGKKDLNGWDTTLSLYETRVLSNLKYKLRPLFRNSRILYALGMGLFGGYTGDPDPEAVAEYSKVERPASYADDVARYYAEHRERVDSRVAEYMQATRWFHAVLEVDQVPHLFVLQPQIHQDTTKPMTENEHAVVGYMFSKPQKMHHRDNFYRLVDARSRELARDDGLPYLSLTNAFAGVVEQAYTDYCHFTPQGNEVFASKLVADLERRFPALFGP